MNRSQLIEHLCRHGGSFGLLKQNYRRKGRLPILRGLTGVRIKALSPSMPAAPHGMTQSCEIIIMPLREGRQYDVLQSTTAKKCAVHRTQAHLPHRATERHRHAKGKPVQEPG
jgi:hypothetical protein